MSKQTIVVPDIGTDEAAEVVEICVAPGDALEQEQSVIVLETDKASVEVPASHGGTVATLLVKEGDQIKTGTPILEIEAADNVGVAALAQETPPQETPPQETNADVTKTDSVPTTPTVSDLTVAVPDFGDSSEVEVIEVCVKSGDTVAEGDSLIVLESDKASMEIPSPSAGRVKSLLVKESDKVVQGQNIVELVIDGSPHSRGVEQTARQPKQQASTPKTPVQSQQSINQTIPAKDDGAVYAGPAVRKLARQLGVDLSKIKATGPRNRVTKNDIRGFVKAALAGGGQGSAIPRVPDTDFSQFGEIEKIKLSKIARATATNMHRSWLNVPHVTQFDDADITELEEYRRQQKQVGIKLTPVPFILKACALTLLAEPSFNVSISQDGLHRIDKKYVHIGMAVDTPAGLMVPVIRDVDTKSIVEISDEINAMAGKAKDGKLTPKEMKGGCFTVSSLGAIGGKGFTPIVNTPEVGILSVSKASFQPVWDGKTFVPRYCLPLGLSYDHRAVNGADAGRFLTHLVGLLADHQKII